MGGIIGDSKVIHFTNLKEKVEYVRKHKGHTVEDLHKKTNLPEIFIEKIIRDEVYRKPNAPAEKPSISDLKIWKIYQKFGGDILRTCDLVKRQDYEVEDIVNRFRNRRKKGQ